MYMISNIIINDLLNVLLLIENNKDCIIGGVKCIVNWNFCVY